MVQSKKIKCSVKCQIENSGIQEKTTLDHENPFEIRDGDTSDVHLLSRKTPNTVSDEFEDQNLSVFDSKLHVDDFEEDELPYFVEGLDDTNLQRELDTAGEAATFEILLPERRMSSQRRTDIRTNGNYCASVLQREVMEASTIGLIGCRASQSGGTWIIYAIINGITVRAKTCLTGSLKVFSYMCSIEVPAELREVWNFIKNPSHRFICDESVKKVKILEELSSDQKIVHVYHEVGILRKECIDFCLLQTERQEQSKSYLAFYSIEFEACPLMDGVTRGTLFPSGFIIEAGSKGNKSTDVKFLFQFMSNIDSTFYQGLDVSVVNVLLNLKTYLQNKPI